MNKLSLKKKVVNYLLQDDTELEVTGTVEHMQSNEKQIESVVGFRFNVLGTDTTGFLYKYHTETDKYEEVFYDLVLYSNKNKVIISSINDKGVHNLELGDLLAELFFRLDPDCGKEEAEDADNDEKGHRCCHCHEDKEYSMSLPDDADDNIYDKDGNVIGKILVDESPIKFYDECYSISDDLRTRLKKLIDSF